MHLIPLQMTFGPTLRAVRLPFAVFGGAVLLGLLSLPLHEGAHWLACKGLAGTGCALFYDIAPGRTAPGLATALKAAAGPATGLFLVALAVVLSLRDGVRRHLAALVLAVGGGWRNVWFAAHYVRLRLRPDPKVQFGADEMVVASTLGLPPGLVVVALGALVLGCWLMIIRRFRARSGVLWFGVVVAGAFLGISLWLQALGPFLLPWK